MTPYYQTELGKLYHGDCLEIMPNLEPVDLVLTDPPYGITSQIWDIEPDWIKLGAEFARLSPMVMAFNMQPTFSSMVLGFSKSISFKDEIVWIYRDGGAGNTKGTGLKNCHQNIGWFSNDKDFLINVDSVRIPYQQNERNKYPVKRGKKIWKENPLGAYPTNIMEYPKHKELKGGKTQFHQHYTIKPLKLIENIIQGFSKETMIVLDAYLGSGTTAIACERLNRRWIGIEIEEKYCEISAKRIEKERSQLKLFT